MTPIIKRLELAEAALTKNGFVLVDEVWVAQPAPGTAADLRRYNPAITEAQVGSVLGVSQPVETVDTLTTFDWGRDGMEPSDDPNAAYCYIRDALAHTARAVAAKQAIIDRLMLEYCPNEMTPEQMETWGNSQRRAPESATPAALPEEFTPRLDLLWGVDAPRRSGLTMLVGEYTTPGYLTAPVPASAPVQGDAEPAVKMLMVDGLPDWSKSFIDGFRLNPHGMNFLYTRPQPNSGRDAALVQALEEIARSHGTGGWQTLADMVRFGRAVLATHPVPASDAALVRAAGNMVAAFNDPHTSIAGVARWVNEVSEALAAQPAPSSAAALVDDLVEVARECTGSSLLSDAVRLRDRFESILAAHPANGAQAGGQ